MNAPPQARPRIASLDALKILAILAVVAIHVPVDPGTPALAWQIFLQFCRFAVPVFFLISGYLFYGSWTTTSDRPALLRRVGGRIIGLFLFWALFYALVPPFTTGAPHGSAAAIGDHFRAMARYPRSFLLTGFVYHLWFLSSLAQAILILWLCLRFASLRVAVALGAVGYAIALAFGPYSSFLLDHHVLNDSRNGPFFSLLFVALGALIASRGRVPGARATAALAITGLLYIYAETTLFAAIGGGAWSNREFSPGTVPFALGIFLLALRHPTCSLGLASFGAYSLGIYAIHPYVIACLLRGPDVILSPGFYPAFALTAFGISTAAAVTLARWRVTRRFVV